MISPGQDFEEYKDKCVEDISSLQDEFIKLYDIDSYEHWFYDHGIGAFHFKSDDGRNLYFKYVDVGSFSTKANTWKWSWDNKTTPLHVSWPLEKVRTFGQANDYEELTQGLFDGDEYTGWALTAVSAKLLSAIGSYRVPQEHLFIYFIFTNELTQEEYDALKDKYIDCETHISGRIAFVCQHLNKDTHIGFHEAFDPDTITDADDGYEAWCDECEKVRAKEGEWNDTSMAFAKIKLVCEQCYFEIKKGIKRLSESDAFIWLPVSGAQVAHLVDSTPRQVKKYFKYGKYECQKIKYQISVNPSFLKCFIIKHLISKILKSVNPM